MIDGWIQTFSGRKFHPLSARAEDVDIRDIAHALSLKCRFNGHCRYFYSVAEHSVRVSRMLEGQGSRQAMWGLMHDAAEAYLADLGGPIKRMFHVHDGKQIETFEQAEDRLLVVIARGLGFDVIDYAAVRDADLTLLMTEARDLMAEPPESWQVEQQPLAEKILPMGWQEAEGMFLARYEELRAGR
jgi:uncharacterized protein